MIFDLKTILEHKYTISDLCDYYACTSFWDYKIFSMLTGSNAMHTLLQISKVDALYPLRYFRQLLYVLLHIDDSARTGNILEIGCGKGINAISLASYLPEAQIDALDLLPAHIHYCVHQARNMKVPNVRFFLGDITDSKSNATFTSSRYNMIFGIESFCNLDDASKRAAFLKFASDALKPKGKIVIIDGFRTCNFDNVPDESRTAMQLAERGFSINAMPSKQQWIDEGKKYGFTVVHDEDLTNYAIPFWKHGWKWTSLLLHFPTLLKWYFNSSPCRKQTGGNFMSVCTVIYSFLHGTAEYGVLVMQLS